MKVFEAATKVLNLSPSDLQELAGLLVATDEEFALRLSRAIEIESIDNKFSESEMEVV